MTRYFKTIKILAIAFSIISAYTLSAQTIDPTVEVEREFDGRMLNIHKSRLKSNIHDSLSNFNLSFNYSIFDKPYKDLYEFSPLPSAELHNKVSEKLPVFVAKGSLSMPFSPQADIHFQPRLKRGHILQLDASYYGFYGKLNTLFTDPQTHKISKNRNIKVSAPNSALKIGTTYGYNWKKGELYLNLGYRNNANAYYGFNTTHLTTPESDPFYSKTDNRNFMKDSCSHRWQQLGAKFNISSIDAKNHGVKFHYKADIIYTHTSDKLPENSTFYNTNNAGYNMKENFIKVSGELGPAFGKYNRFTIGFNSENVIYEGIQEYKYGLYEIIPQYSFEKGRLKLRAGIKISGRYKGKDDTDIYHNMFFAKGSLSFEIAKNSFWLYANVDGGNRINNYSALLDSNPWISQNSDLRASSIPFLVQGGFRGDIHNKFSYNIFAKYAIHEGLLQYTANMQPGPSSAHFYDSRLNTIYSNHREFTVGGELKWDTKDFTAGTILEYSSYTKSKNSTLKNNMSPLGYAPFKWHTYATYNYRERIWISATSDFRSATPTWCAEYPDADMEFGSVLNIGINIRYAISRNLSAFLTGENLLDKQIQYYPQYLEKGLSFGVGILVKL